MLTGFEPVPYRKIEEGEGRDSCKSGKRLVKGGSQGE